MPLGPGKYDDVCTEVREKTKAEGAVVIVINGDKGPGFSCQCTIDVLRVLPEMLRNIANQLQTPND